MSQANNNEELHVAKGNVIFNRGDMGEEMYLVASGQVRLIIGEGEHRREIARLGPGEFFGELSLLSSAPRNATAEATEETVLVPIRRSAFGLMMQDDLEVVFRMLNTQGERLRQANLPMEDFVRRFGQLRIGLEAVRRSVVGLVNGPTDLDIKRIATELGVSIGVVSQTAEEYSRAGAGALNNDQWRIESWQQLGKLIEALSRETEI